MTAYAHDYRVQQKLLNARSNDELRSIYFTIDTHLKNYNPVITTHLNLQNEIKELIIRDDTRAINHQLYGILDTIKNIIFTRFLKQD